MTNTNTNNNPLAITEQQFTYFQTLQVVSGFLAAEETVERTAVVYHGMVQYLTHEERVRIIQGAGADYDSVPMDFDGPLTKDDTEIQFIERWRDCPYHVATEWDGTKHPIYAEKVPNTYAYGGEMYVLYQDGVCHRMRMADFRQLVGKEEIPRLYGRPTNPVEIVDRAMRDAERVEPCDVCTDRRCNECPVGV